MPEGQVSGDIVLRSLNTTVRQNDNRRLRVRQNVVTGWKCRKIAEFNTYQKLRLQNMVECVEMLSHILYKKQAAMNDLFGG